MLFLEGELQAEVEANIKAKWQPIMGDQYDIVVSTQHEGPCVDVFIIL